MFISFGTFIAGHPTTFICKICWKSKYCLKTSKTWESKPVPISSIFYFKIVGQAYENGNHEDLFIFFLLAYLRFSEVECFKFYYQDKTIIVKNGLLKISVYEKRPLESYNESMDKHGF